MDIPMVEANYSSTRSVIIGCTQCKTRMHGLKCCTCNTMRAEARRICDAWDERRISGDETISELIRIGATKQDIERIRQLVEVDEDIDRLVQKFTTDECTEGEGEVRSEPPCRCESDYICVRHLDIMTVSANHTSTGPTNEEMPRQQDMPPVERLTIDRSMTQGELEEWADSKGMELGPCIPDDQRLDVLQTLWTYRGLESTGLKTLGPPTHLITHRMRIKQGTPIYKAKARMMARDKEWWYRKFALDGLDSGMFERTVQANGRLSQWGADPVLVKKPGKDEPRLTFNYHYVWEEPPGNQMQLSRDAHAFLSLPSHQTFSQFDLKNAYWTVEVHPEDRHYLAFSVPGIGQLQPTRMAQGARSSSFTMNELGGIAFGQLTHPRHEPSFLHNPQGPEHPPDMTYYIDDMFAGHSSWDKQWNFIKNHLLPRLRWARLKLSLDKVKIGVMKMLALGEIHHVGGAISPKPARVAKILDWPTPQNQTDVRGFLGTVIMTRQFIKNYAELTRPLTRLTGKGEWQWGEAEELAFRVVKNKAATTVLLYGWEPQLPVEMFVDASKYAAGCFIRQRQDDRWVPILYDSFAFSATERNYDTYKRELKGMVVFAEKHSHMLNGPITSTIWTDHEPLTKFLTGNNHADIFFRWLERLRPLNITIKHIQGKKNTAADGLSRTLFPDSLGDTELTSRLLEEARKHDKDGKREWFWKSGKGGYEETLREATQEEQRLKQSQVKPEVRAAFARKRQRAEGDESEGGNIRSESSDEDDGITASFAHKRRRTERRRDNDESNKSDENDESEENDESDESDSSDDLWEKQTDEDTDSEEGEEGDEAEVPEEEGETESQAPDSPAASEEQEVERELCQSCMKMQPVYGVKPGRGCRMAWGTTDESDEPVRVCTNCKAWHSRRKKKVAQGLWKADPACRGCGATSTKRWYSNNAESAVCQDCHRKWESRERATYKKRKPLREKPWRRVRWEEHRKQYPNSTPSGFHRGECAYQHRGRQNHERGSYQEACEQHCGHLCCQSRTWTLDMAEREKEKFTNLPKVAGNAQLCRDSHQKCNKDSCDHYCCRMDLADCRLEHITCDRRICDHVCCKIWIPWVEEDSQPPRLKSGQFKKKRQAEKQDNLDRLSTHWTTLNQALGSDELDHERIVGSLWDIKETVTAITGRKYYMSKVRPRAEFDITQSREWSMPSVEGVQPQRQSREADAQSIAPTRRTTRSQRTVRLQQQIMEDGEARALTDSPGRTNDESTSLLDDSKPLDNEPAPSEFTGVSGYQVICANQVSAEAQLAEWDHMHDQWYGDVTRYLRDGTYPSDWGKQQRHKLARYAGSFRLREGKLERRLGSGAFVPCAHPKDIPRILQATHDKSGHFNSEVVTKKLRGRIFWPTLTPDVKEYVSTCKSCARWAYRQRSDPLVSLDALNPWELVQADLMGPYSESNRGNKWLLVMICCFTSFTITRALPDKSGPIVREAIESVFDTFGSAMVLYTDTGGEFVDLQLEEALKERGTLLRHAPAKSHRATGAVESVNRVLKRCITKTSPIYINAQGRKIVDFREWDIAARQCTLAANERYMPALGYSPAEIVLGTLPGQLKDMELAYPLDRQQQLASLTAQMHPADIPEGDLQQACLQLMTQRAETQGHVRQNRVNDRKAREDRWMSSVKPQQVQIGDWVLIEADPWKGDRQGMVWEGPFQVMEFTGDHGKSVKLWDLEEGREIKRSRHVGQLRVLKPRPARLRVMKGDTEGVNRA